MADERSSRRRRAPESQGSTTTRRRRRTDESAAEDRPRRRASRSRPSAAQLAQRAREAVAEIMGVEPESISGMERSDDGTWKVTMEVLEVSRVPDTDDVLGTYEAEIAEDGELLGYSRVRRYARSQAGGSSGPQGR